MDRNTLAHEYSKIFLAQMLKNFSKWSQGDSEKAAEALRKDTKELSQLSFQLADAFIEESKKF